MVDREPSRGRFRRTKVALVGLAIAAADLGPAPAAAASPELRFSVSATWPGQTDTGIVLAPGQEYDVRYVGGGGTVDYRNYPPVGPKGYDRLTDSRIYDQCKSYGEFPYGAAVGHVGRTTFLLGTERTRRKAPVTGGPLTAEYNDLDACKGDNRNKVNKRTGVEEPITYVVTVYQS